MVSLYGAFSCFPVAGSKNDKSSMAFIRQKNLFYIKSLTNRRLSITNAFIFAM
jgi:hypothetical protein